MRLNFVTKLSRALVFTLLATTLLTTGCATTTEDGEVGAGRKQLMLIPSSQIEKASIQGYDQLKAEAAAKGTLDRKPDQVQRVKTIMKRLIPPTSTFRKDASAWPWEVHVIQSDELNAFCMPGGKIIFYSGIIDQLNLSDAEIAAIMGHEISHALREHGRERMSEELLKQLGLQVLVASGKLDPKYAQAAALITNIAITLRHSRAQETEADNVGLELMARAGYDPNAAVTLWQKMDQKAGGKAPPEFLSTHPSSKSRIQDIRELVPRVMPLYNAASSG